MKGVLLWGGQGSTTRTPAGNLSWGLSTGLVAVRSENGEGWWKGGELFGRRETQGEKRVKGKKLVEEEYVEENRQLGGETGVGKE